MTFELWSQSSGNVVGEFDTEEAALAEVRAMLAESGRATVAGWLLALGSSDENRRVVMGDELLDLASSARTTA